MPREKNTSFYVVKTTRPAPEKAKQMVLAAAEEEAARFIEGFGPIRDKCESPIEEILMAALYVASSVIEVPLHFMMGDTPSPPAFDTTAFIYQQVSVGRYRVDILIVDQTLPFDRGPPRMMVIECDGHDFHERTKDQARRDKQRDRFLQSKGFKVLRFTGSEIWADPDKCADEIINELRCNDDWRNRNG